eukprot:TRINITY_DN2465_c0_g1_i1.p1 TRINITY_DN2465_c0_g1~~TRINITY_DN2465_c0_g1_i1.p1  ORF type:complete len:547 (-),score=120.71 TRINITY_DN2465_c0_g1_i1:219-1859(-)
METVTVQAYSRGAVRPSATAAAEVTSALFNPNDIPSGVKITTDPNLLASSNPSLRRLNMLVGHFDGASTQHQNDKTIPERYSENTEKWINWAHIHSCVPKYYHQPSSIDEIIDIVNFARARKEKIRVVGASHSPSDIAKVSERDHMINLDRFNKILSIDGKTGLVKVQAGIRIRDINEELSKHEPPLALSVLGSISDQSLAGAISTATHGTGIEYGSLSCFVREIELVTGSGQLWRCSRNENPDLFSAACCSVGALGVIVTITMQMEPAYNLHAVQYPAEFDTVVSSIKQTAYSAEHARFWWFPHTNKCLIWQANRTDRPVDPQPHQQSLVKQWTDYIKDTVIGYKVLEASLWCSNFVPELDPTLNSLYQRMLFNSRQERVDRSDKVFNFNCLFKQYVNEWAIPIENTEAALIALKEMIAKSGFRVHFPVEVRFVKGDDIMLSPCYGRDCCYIGIIMYRPYGREPNWKKYFFAFEELMARFDGRPHWAKEFVWKEPELRKAYPRWGDFVNIAKQCDPSRVFWNSFMERVFEPKPLLPSDERIELSC